MYIMKVYFLSYFLPFLFANAKIHTYVEWILNTKKHKNIILNEIYKNAFMCIKF